MKRYRITSVIVPEYPVLRLTFDDGLVGDLDLSAYLERGSFYAPLKDEAFFRSVAMAEDGRSFGWRLDQLFSEIGFCADAARTDIETTLVVARADCYRRSLPHAAE